MKSKKIVFKKSGIGEEEKEIIDETVEEELNLLKKFGFNSPKRPPGQIPILPEDITQIDPIELGRLHGKYVAWLQYANYIVSLAESTIKSMTFRIKRLKENESMYVREAEKKLVERKIFKDLAEEMRKGLKEGKDLLSREQSRRRDLEPSPR